MSDTPEPGVIRESRLHRQIPVPGRAERWPIAGLTALVLWMFRESIFEGRVFFRRDITLIWYPQVEVFVRCIASGSWPVWDPYRGFGEPLLADPSSQVLYPLTWLNLLMPPWAYYTLFAASHVLLSALGLYALGRRWGLSRGGSFVAAAIWAVSGPFLSLVDLYHHLASAAWIPWVLLAADRALTSAKTSHALVWGAVAAAQILAGSADMVAFTALAVALFAIVSHARWGTPWRGSNARLMRTAAVAAAFALALTAALWLPVAEASLGSDRWNLPYETRTLWSIHPRALLEVLFPFRWLDLPLLPALTPRLLDARKPWLHSIYLGIPATGLVLASVWSRTRLRGLLLALVVGAMLIALGRHFFAYDVAVFLVPPLRIVRYPAKFMVLSAFAWSFLAGAGFDVWRSPGSRLGSKSMRPIVGILLALAGLATLTALLTGPGADRWGPLMVSRGPGFPPYAEILGPTSRAMAFCALLASATVVVAALRSRGPLWASRSAAGVALLATLDLMVTHHDLNYVAPKELFTLRPPVLDALERGAHGRLYSYDYSLFRTLFPAGDPRRNLIATLGTIPASLPDEKGEALTAGAAQTYLSPPIGARWGLYGSYDADILGLLPAPVRELSRFLRLVENTPGHLRLLRMGSVTNVITLHEDGWTRELIRAITLRGLFGQPIHVFRVPDPLPRTYAVGDARVADGTEALQVLTDPTFDLGREVLLPDGPVRRVGERFSGTSRVTLMQPDRVRLDADLSEAGYVVLVDGYHRGWRATVDGRESPVLRANVAFRAVAVPAGRHVLELFYRPPAVLVGLTVSAGAFLLGLVLLGRWLTA